MPETPTPHNPPDWFPRFPVRIVSDLHLGHSGCIIESVEEVRPLLAGVPTVIFNGDTFEERADAFRPRSKEMVAELINLCEGEGVEPVFVSGNHDPGRWERHHVQLLGGAVLVTHGDTLYELVSPWSKKIEGSREAIGRIRGEYSEEALRDLATRLEFTKRSCLEMSVFESELERGVFAKASTLIAELWPPRRPAAILSAWATAPGRAFDLLETCCPEAQLLVFGHTHLPGVWRKDGRTVVNTGGYLALCNARAVDVAADGEVIVRKVSRGARQLTVSGTGRRIAVKPLGADSLGY